MSNKILFVDDDPNIQKMVEIFLRDQNYQITYAKNGRSALRFFEKEKYNLVITDVQMPEMDGLTLAKEIRIQDKKIPILIVSAFGQENMNNKVLGEQAFVISKPFERNELIDVIEKNIKP
ncbi:MAG: response regulator [Calditrichaeota bacterium]|nr:MAG: response regulator [Calditrichota bacterium]MBL1206934.1 response regulator [Calditrichota bacterium]NOG46761.1 response regulator [Calditrichota bacterium]